MKIFRSQIEVSTHKFEIKYGTQRRLMKLGRMTIGGGGGILRSSGRNFKPWLSKVHNLFPVLNASTTRQERIAPQVA